VLVGARPAGQRHESDLPRDAVRTAEQLAADDQPHADARANVHEREIVDIPAVAERALGQGGGVHVVLHHQRRPERLPQPGQRRGAVPATQAAGELQRVPARVVDSRAADHGLGDGRPWHARVLAQHVRQLDELGHPPADARSVGPQRFPGPDFPGEVGDRAADIFEPDVQAEHQACVGPDLVQPRRPARHAGPLPGDADQAGPLDIAEGQRHRGLGQAGDPGQLGPRAGTKLADVLEQQLLVHRPDQRGTRGEQARPRPLGGNPPDLARLPTGCRFHPRCPLAVERCTQVTPGLYEVDGTLVRCLRLADGSTSQRTEEHGSLTQ
jgi:oligopeptide/dipeptide ABC transporter ATP-binding protein